MVLLSVSSPTTPHVLMLSITLGTMVKGSHLRFVAGRTGLNILVQTSMEINCPLKLLIRDYVFCASDYNKMWCSLQKQTHVVVLTFCAKMSPTCGAICYFLYSSGLF
jgi:hypothetical protein